MRRTTPIGLLALLALLLTLVPVAHAQNLIEIEYGESVRGRITDPDEGVLYVFQGRAGEEISINLTSDQTDVYLRLGDSQGNLLAETDDISPNNLNARLDYELPANGEYIVVALAYNPGSYELLVTQGGGGGAAQGQSQGDGTLSYGESATGQVTDTETPVVFSFEGQAGDSVQIAVVSDAVDPLVVLANASGDVLAENDDISSENLNAYVEVVLPATGTYLIGVLAYDPGPFEVILESGGGGATPVAETDGGAETQSGRIDNQNYFVEIPINGVRDGDTITVDAVATSGDLDLYLGLFFGEQVVAENDDRTSDNINPLIEFPQAQAGDYTLIVTRYGFEEGRTSGSFEVGIKVSAAPTTIVSTEALPQNVAAAYPAMTPTSTVADWLVLVYLGADNNLEPALENDLDELERAGGSDQDVRVLALMDRSREYSNANGNWSDTRLFEVGEDSSRDFQFTYPPTIDSRTIANFGELDTSYANNLLDFIVWGVRTYPAQRYAFVLNDHGGAWHGIVTDDTTGPGEILTIPELVQVFDAASKITGVERFDLLVNDACLMSSVEYYAAMSRFFDYSISSPEVTLNPGFDMELFLAALKRRPDIEMGQLGQLVIDKYMQDMRAVSPDTLPVLGAAVTDLRNFDVMTDAIDAFARIVAENPQPYISMLGQARANTYSYSFFIPQDPASNMDVGDFMVRVARATDDAQLRSAAEDVLAAIREVLVYGSAGPQLESFTSYYNLYFPTRATTFEANYFQETPLVNWAQMLRAFFTGAAVETRASFRSAAAAPGAAPPAAPSVVPIVNIVSVFPQEDASINLPVTIQMEVTGRNMTEGRFTVDQIQPDGTLVRLETSRIVTEVVVDNVIDYINLWNPGVDDSDFTWDVELPVVSDGDILSYEQITTIDGISSIGGRYQFPGSEQWLDVTIIFDDDGNTDTVITSSEGVGAFAPLQAQPGGLFQAYRAEVSPDGQVVNRPGTTFTWPEGGLISDRAPAPSGAYRLGFQVEAIGGVTGFNSVELTVANADSDETLRGYVDDEWGFIIQRPTAWFPVNYFPEPNFLQTSDLDTTEYIFAYPQDGSSGDLNAIAQALLDQYDLRMDGKPLPITVDGVDALEFAFTYTNDTGTFTSRDFAFYQESIDLGMVISAEAIDPERTDELFDLLVDTTVIFDPTILSDLDQGFWTRDTYTDAARYPTPETWMPGNEDGLWWYYRPDNAITGDTFAAVTVLMARPDETASDVTELLLRQEMSGQMGYELLGTETYYAELHTWQQSDFTFTGESGQRLTAQMYVVVVDEVPYALWFAAPEDEYNRVFRDVFTVMLDGFRITSEDE